MQTLSLNIIAVGLYFLASLYLLALLKKSITPNKNRISLIIGACIIFHGIGLNPLILNNQGVDLSLFNMASLVILVINSIVLVSSLKKPLQNLFIFLPPLSIVAITASVLKSTSNQHYIDINIGVASHILLSIVAYSLLAIATLQALIWSWQNHQIKHHHIQSSPSLLPPLQTMEQLMYEMLWAGVILLTAAIIAGLLFLENIFDQQLVHKTVLSLLAWSVFASLLIGHYRLGWRGNKAVKFILGGFCILMLAYFGSKVVIEIILA